MIKKSIKSRFCIKAIAALLALGLMCPGVAMAEIALEPTVTVDDVTLTVKCGIENAGKGIMVQVFNPDGDIDDLKGASGEYDVTDAAKIDAALCCVYQGILDANGDLTFTFAPTGDKGKYATRIFVEGMYSAKDDSVEFICDDDAAAILAELALDPEADNVEELFEKSENINVYKPYQILQLDKSTIYGLYDASDVKDKIYAYLAKGVEADTDITPSEFVTLFEDAVLVESLDIVAEEDVVDFVSTHAEKMGVDAKKGYTKIFEDDERFSEDVESGFAKIVADAALTGKPAADVADFVSESFLLALLSNTDSQGIMDAVIGDFEDELEAAGADIGEYNDTSKPLDVCRTLIGKQPFDSVEDFADELNDAIPSSSKKPSRPSTPSGGGGGVSYSTGGSTAEVPEVVIPTDNGSVSKPQLIAGFSDLANVSWAHDAIAYLKDKGIIAGKPDGTFAPNDNVTREEFVKMLVIALGLDENNQSTEEFSDVKGDEWFAPYVFAAYNSGIVKGTGAAFGTGANISRQDMAVMCARALEIKGITLNPVRGGMTFTDSISDYAAESVEKLWSAGIVNGLSEAEFGAFNTASRAQAAKILYEVLKSIG